MEEKKKKRFFKKIKTKYRLVLRTEDTFHEKGSILLSPLNVFLLLVGFASLLVLTVVLMIVYTPLKEYIPGYTDLTLRKDITELALKADSLENAIVIKDNYIKNINALVQDVPIKKSPNQVTDSTIKDYKNIKFDLAKEDSMLRAYIEQEEKYSLNYNSAPNPNSMANLLFFVPLTGAITNEFNLEDEHYGIDIASPENEAIKSALDGTVVFSGWTSETGYVIQIQHQNNFISSYKHNSVLLKKTGEYVKAGEPIAIVGNTGEMTTGPHLHFELWFNGYPVDPKKYIMF